MKGLREGASPAPDCVWCRQSHWGCAVLFAWSGVLSWSFGQWSSVLLRVGVCFVPFVFVFVFVFVWFGSARVEYKKKSRGSKRSGSFVCVVRFVWVENRTLTFLFVCGGVVFMLATPPGFRPPPLRSHPTGYPLFSANALFTCGKCWLKAVASCKKAF